MIEPNQPSKPMIDLTESTLTPTPVATHQPSYSPAEASEPSHPPSRSLEALDALGERIAVLSAQIQAATYHLLVMIREFDERHGWNWGVSDYAFRSCAHWLNWRTGLEMGAAREKVRVARALGELPRISESMRRGELSYSKVRALSRVATPDNEAELLEFAKAGTAAHVEKLVRAWRRVDRIDELEQENLRFASRYLQVHTDEDGMVVLRARLDPEAGAAFVKALEAASKMLFEKVREEEIAGERMRDDAEPSETSEQRRADALGLVAEAALAHGLEASPSGERLQVVVHVDAEVLKDPEQPGMSMLEDGRNVSAETSRRLACDSAKVVMQHDSDGNILAVGRRTRAITTASRRALSHRDKSCQFPGCEVGHCDAHHLRHWANGGETNLDNLVLLCRRHHRSVHEGGFRIEGPDDSKLRFFRPDGREMPVAPGLKETCDRYVSPLLTSTDPLADPMAALAVRLLEDGVDIDSQTGLPSWDGKPLDLAWAVDGYRRLGRGEPEARG